jgi:hypothetical protein
LAFLGNSGTEIYYLIKPKIIFRVIDITLYIFRVIDITLYGFRLKLFGFQVLGLNFMPGVNIGRSD